MHARAGILLAVLAGAGEAVGAQAIRGRLVGAVSGQPVAGALIMLIDSGRLERVRTATRQDGEFRVAAPAPGTFRLVALRIGFARWESPSLALARGQTIEFVAELPEEPLRLTAITVERESGCRVRPGAGETVGMVWEEARKALALADLSRREGTYLFRAVTTERSLSTTFRPLEEPRVRKAGLSTWPFASLPAESLARRGFVQDSAGEVIYWGPDVDVLFSEAFLELHCFRLHAERDSALVGLEFEPLPTVRLPDISGVLWLDRRTARLVRLEFSYTNLEDWVPPRGAGGRIEFDVLPTGAWVISRWVIRAPVPRIRVAGTNQTRVLHGYHESLGQVGEILTRDGRVLTSYPPEP